MCTVGDRGLPQILMICIWMLLTLVSRACAIFKQAEMVRKEQQIQALKAKASSRSTLMPLLMNGVSTCERKVSEEVMKFLSPELSRKD